LASSKPQRGSLKFTQTDALAIGFVAAMGVLPVDRWPNISKRRIASYPELIRAIGSAATACPQDGIARPCARRWSAQLVGRSVNLEKPRSRGNVPLTVSSAASTSGRHKG
jgi:hypothetical protein